MSFPFFLAVFTLIFLLGVSIEIGLGIRQIKALKDVLPLKEDGAAIQVSIIIPACNEGKTIGPALTSVLDLDYENLEIIVVNDRSTDNTKEVLEQIAGKYPQLKLLDVSQLPKGWLGKNHALHLGTQHATGEYLLFTDADVIMEHSTLKRAMRYVRKNQLDHLSIFCDITVPGKLLNAMILEFGGGLFWIFKPWKANDSRSKRFMGVGAFNLLRASAYKESGGHRAIAMCPIDDVMLGKLIKMKGFRQECLFGHGFVSVEWYTSVKEMMDGLTKNTFAGFDYSISKVFMASLLYIVIGIWPFWALFFTGGLSQVINSLIIAVRLISFADASRRASINPWYSLWTILSTYLSFYMTWRATLTTIINKGITWRGTYYPLEELKSCKIKG